MQYAARKKKRIAGVNGRKIPSIPSIKKSVPNSVRFQGNFFFHMPIFVLVLVLCILYKDACDKPVKFVPSKQVEFSLIAINLLRSCMALLQKNIGNRDKALRAIIALILFALSYHYHSLILFLCGAFVVFEVTFSWCAFYQLIGRNTHRKQKK